MHLPIFSLRQVYPVLQINPALYFLLLYPEWGSMDLAFCFQESTFTLPSGWWHMGRDISLVWSHFCVHLLYCFYFWLCFLGYLVWQEYGLPFLRQRLWHYSFLYGFCDRFNHKRKRLFRNRSILFTPKANGYISCIHLYPILAEIFTTSFVCELKVTVNSYTFPFSGESVFKAVTLTIFSYAASCFCSESSDTNSFSLICFPTL